MIDDDSTDLAGEDDGWIGQFHLYSFHSLTLADRRIERRELVWIKRFFLQRDQGELYDQLLRCIEDDDLDPDEFPALITRAREHLPAADKRRFIYNMAQLCKSKGKIGSEEYGNILEISEKIGVEDTEADSIINSVFSINDSFTAIMGLLALGVILYFTQSVIVPMVIAMFITMIVNKVEGLVKVVPGFHRIRVLTKLGAMVVILGVLFGLVMAAVVSGQDIAKRWPSYEQKGRLALQKAQAMAVERGIPLPDTDGMIKQAQRLPIGSTISGFFSGLFNLLGNFILVVVFTGFLVFSKIPYRGILQEMNEKIGIYVSVKTVMGLLTGVGVYLICLGFGIDFALFWATISFLLNFIPSVGSIIASVPPILLSTIQLSSWASVLFYGACLIVMHLCIGQVLEPKLMGSRLAVKPLAILLGLIFWGFLWGLPGMFLAAPLMALLRILASYFNFSRNFERMLADDR